MRRVFYAVGLAVALSASALAQVNYTTNGTSGERLDALSECASLAVAGYGKASIDVVATPSFTGTLTFYVIGPGGTQTAVNSTPPNSTTAVTTTTAAGQWGADVAGKTGLRACFTAYTSGAATVYLSASSAGGGSSGGGGGGAGTSDTTEATQLSVLAAVDGLETNTAATLTSTNFAAAFGTAGTADTQVMSVQGIASGTALTVSASNLDVQIGGSDTVTVSATNLDIQSGGADVATQATLASVLTEQTAAAATLSDIEAALAADATHDSAVVATGPQIVAEAKNADGTLPNAVAEGDAVRIAATLSGVVYTFPTTQDGAQSSMKIDDAGFTAATSAATVIAGVADTTPDSVDEDDVAALRTTLDRKLVVTNVPHTSQGLDIFRSIDLDEGTGEVVKGSAGQLYGGIVTNTATATRWIKFYNATSCTMGTGTPVLTIGIPGNTSDDIAGNLNVGAHGLSFSTGICVGSTTGVADNDTGAPGANDVVINLFYK